MFWLEENLILSNVLIRVESNFDDKYRISSYNCRGNYSFLEVEVRQLFKGGNYSREETIEFLGVFCLYSLVSVC